MVLLLSEKTLMVESSGACYIASYRALNSRYAIFDFYSCLDSHQANMCFPSVEDHPKANSEASVTISKILLCKLKIKL